MMTNDDQGFGKRWTNVVKRRHLGGGEGDVQLHLLRLIPGLDSGIHVDGRVKPGHEEFEGG